MMFQGLPFPLTKNESFYEALNKWIGDVLYDILPEKGFELRDEQIFMAFQLDRAFKEKKVMFAEAGVGTGKTIVYLLYAIAYARYTGRPAVIACADEALIEQLVKKQGDIKKLEEALGLKVDVRLAKSMNQYLCLDKLEDLLGMDDDEDFFDLYESLPEFVHDQSGWQSYYHYGDRKQYPFFSDEKWEKISWDPFKNCLSCSKRHRCGLILSRDYYRKAKDLIVCSHDFYMEHIWTKESRKREGQLPLLPEHSCVVFDEGHLLEFAAQKALTYQVKKETLAAYLEKILKNNIREQLAEMVEEALLANDHFFHMLFKSAHQKEGSNRLTITRTDDLLEAAGNLYERLNQLSEALVFESELYTIDEYSLKIVEEYLDQMEFSFRLFLQFDNTITWLEQNGASSSFVIMPQRIEDILKEKVFSHKIPYIFSSATLSDQNGSFAYLANSLGIKDYLSFSVSSPFDYEKNMKVFVKKGTSEEKLNWTESVIKSNKGRTLILCRTKEELLFLKKHLPSFWHSCLFEGDYEISELVASFERDPETVLCAVHLWEGLDVPGPSLEHVIIWSLPFPPDDPVFDAKRKSATDPFYEVDLPYMILRLKQGVGRLLRTKDDHGTVTIFISKDEGENIVSEVVKALPVKPS